MDWPIEKPSKNRGEESWWCWSVKSDLCSAGTWALIAGFPSGATRAGHPEAVLHEKGQIWRFSGLGCYDIPWYPMFSCYNVGPPFSIAKLVNITPMSLWFMIRLNNYSFHGIYKPTNITGGAPHWCWCDDIWGVHSQPAPKNLDSQTPHLGFATQNSPCSAGMWWPLVKDQFFWKLIMFTLW